MVSKKNSVIIAAVLALCCVISAVYISSCTKPKKGPSCDYVVCENGGYCAVDTVFNGVKYKADSALVHCNCPAGFEGPTCATGTVSKYVGSGTWDVKQTVMASDTASLVGKVSYYTAFIKQSGTATTFFINNFCDSNNYNDIVCTIDSTNSSLFVIDTLSAFHMFYQHFKLVREGKGSISADDSTITATVMVRHLNYNVNWQMDSLKMVFTPHHF